MVLLCFLRRREGTCYILRTCGELVRQHIRKVAQCPKGHLLRRFFIVFVYTFSRTAQANKNFGLRTFALTGRWDDGMTLISQGAAPLALGYGHTLGFQPATTINDINANERPEGASAERT